MGLDYTVHPANYNQQVDMLKRMVCMASNRGLPIVLHCRSRHVEIREFFALDDALQVLKSLLPVTYPVYLHCFNGSLKEVRAWQTVFPGVMFGITGIILSERKRHSQLPRVVSTISSKRLLMESDGQYLPLLGNVASTPWDLNRIAKKIAILRKDTTDRVIRATHRNARKFFSLPVQQVK